jgi:hypothetical protein
MKFATIAPGKDYSGGKACRRYALLWLISLAAQIGYNSFAADRTIDSRPTAQLSGRAHQPMTTVWTADLDFGGFFQWVVGQGQILHK